MAELVGSPAVRCLLCGFEVERYREVKVAGDWTAAVSQLTRLLLFWSQYSTVQYICSADLLKESYRRYCCQVELQPRQLFKCTISNGLPFLIWDSSTALESITLVFPTLPISPV